MIKKITLLGIIVLFTLLFIYCTTDDATILGPFGNASKYITIANFSADKTVLYSNGDTSLVSIKVLDVDNTPAIGLIVGFTTQFGSITESAITDSSGIALAIFISDDNIGENIITADTGVKKYELYLHVVHYQPKYVELFADSNLLLADGISKTNITAVVKDSTGNPMPDVTVRFSTTLGTLSTSIIITNSEGIAETILMGGSIEGQAHVTATAYITNVTIIYIVSDLPSAIYLESSEVSILADGMSTSDISATAYNIYGETVPGVSLDFSTSFGSVSRSQINTDQDGLAQIALTSAGSIDDVIATVRAAVTSDTSSNENINIQLRGITSFTSIDSTIMSDGGIYKAYIRTNLFETINGPNISNGTVLFSPPAGIGEMVDHTVSVDATGTAISVFETEVLPTNQNNIIITSQLSSAPVLTDTVEFDIPGVEMLINTIDDEVMGDGEGWVLAKATLREITGEAITSMEIDWETEVGTIIGQSRTDTSGHAYATLRIENSVSSDTDVAIIAKYGDYISASDIVTFIPPVNDNRLILGFEPDISRDSSYVACDIDVEFAIRDVGISALFVDAIGNGIDWQLIYFSVVPNNFARICERAYTRYGIATVMLAYPPQNGGEIVRVWGKAPDGTRGSIDVVLPVVGEE